MLTDPSGVDKPVQLDCPKCGKPLSVHGSRLDTGPDGQPEWVHIYLFQVAAPRSCSIQDSGALWST
jgi:hypothetical protein